MLGKLLKPFKGHDRHLAYNRVDPVAATITLTSPAFSEGHPIPRRYAGEGVGDNVSPPLCVSGVPHGTQDLLLVIQDPDAPLPRPLTHLIARVMVAAHEIPEGALNAGQAVGFGKASFGWRGYMGPRPIPGHGPHRYVFQIFAANRSLNIGPDGSLDDYLEVMKDRLVARGRLTGTFER
jgi:Raf kinase inhibitor-like YbhB/YbcL family protein